MTGCWLLVVVDEQGEEVEGLMALVSTLVAELAAQAGEGSKSAERSQSPAEAEWAMQMLSTVVAAGKMALLGLGAVAQP